MVNRVFMWAAADPGSSDRSPRIRSPAAHRFVAAERLEEALEAAAELDSRGIGSILDLRGEGVEDPSGVGHAVVPATDHRCQHMGG